MNINLENVATSVSAVKKLSNIDLGTPALNYKLMSVLAIIESESQKYIELQKGIIEKHRDKSKKEIIIPSLAIDAFNKEMQEAGAIEVDVEWEKIDCKVDALVGFSANDMKCLNNLFINIKGD